RKIGARKSVPAVVAANLQNVDDLAHLLILQEAPNQLSAWIVPRLVALSPRQQHLSFDPDETRCHLQVIGSLIEAQRRDSRQELFSDARHRDVVDVDLLVA